MAYKTFLAGTEGLASDINTYLMNQSVMVFTNATARLAAIPTPTEGMVTYLTGNDHFAIYSGTEWVVYDIGWNAWTPTLTNLTLSTTGSPGTISAFYARIGKTIVAQVYCNVGTTPTIGGQFSISLPVDIANSNRSGVIGTCLMRDAVGAVSYLGSVLATGSAPSVARMQTIGTAGATATLSSQAAANPFAWTNSNSYFSFTIMYQGV
jgi:hypothetical protein